MEGCRGKTIRSKEIRKPKLIESDGRDEKKNRWNSREKKREREKRKRDKKEKKRKGRERAKRKKKERGKAIKEQVGCASIDSQPGHKLIQLVMK